MCFKDDLTIPGEVYRARDTKLGRDVAIKVLPESFSKDADRLARFEREARAVAALSHPNILAIYDFGSDGGHVYTVCELLEGETLRERIGRGALATRKAIDYGVQVARGLAAAHEKGIAHRDLKPENLFVTHDGRVKILDFGLAKTQLLETTSDAHSSAPTRAAGTEPGVVLGTIGYMSPEQVRGERADYRADIFAFGAVLYEMLSGRRAFHRDTSAETMTAILKEEPSELSGIDNAPPPALERIWHRCLEKNPGERFQSAYDLAFAIESISRESGPAPVDLAMRAPRGRSVVAAVLALLLVGAAYWLGKSAAAPGDVALPTYERLTFRRGTLHTARFDPAGRNVIYAASWDGHDPELFSTLPGSRESRALGLPKADVLSVSPSGEMAVLRRPRVMPWRVGANTGTLALSTSAGGAAREVAEDVLLADWDADGQRLVVVRQIDRRVQVELPIGTVVYETTNGVDSLRFSPEGDMIAFGEKAPGFATNWFIVFMILDGEAERFDTGVRGDFFHLAWSPDGREIWFNSTLGGNPDLQAMSRTGATRFLARPPIPLRILDVARDGRVLVARGGVGVGVMGVAPGESQERDFSWLDGTEIDGITGDGKTLLLTEFGDGGGESWSVYLRNADGSPAVRLGGGQAFDLSPDGKWVLTMLRGQPGSLVLLPTGPGTPLVIENETIVDFSTASFVTDEREVVFAGGERGAALRWFRQSVPGGEPRPITGAVQHLEGYDLGSSPVSPDGSILAATKDGVLALYPLDGGEPRPLDEVPASMKVIRFTPDGRFLYVKETVGRSVRVHRVEIETGRRELWKTIAPSDPTALDQIYAIQISDDGESYYYTFMRKYSDLFIVDGLR